MTPEQSIQGVTLKHTIASKRGTQWVEQCLSCGTLACVTSTAATLTSRGQLGACPACGNDGNWSLQRVPAVGMFQLEQEGSP